MIAFIEGRLLEKKPDRIIVIAGQIGYDIEIPLTTYYALPEDGEIVKLHIFTMVREDAIRLFGFKNSNEKKMFEILLGVSRIGPKLALAIQSGLEFDQLRQAILTENIQQLISIPGLGKKSAERLIFEAREKMNVLSMALPGVASTADDQQNSEYFQEVVSLLINLGYKRKEAEMAMDSIRDDFGKHDLQTMIKESLKFLSGRR